MRGQLHFAVTPSLHAAALISLGRQGDGHRVTSRHHAVTRPAVPSGDKRLIVVSAQPTPELLTAVGHALLRSVAIGQGDPLRSAADAIARLERLLPGAGAEAQMVAVLLAVTDDATSQPVVASPAPTPQSQPHSARRQAKAGKPVKQTRKPKASAPLIDVNGRLISSKGIGGVAVISQAEARKALGMSCIQMLKLENQKLLSRIQESGSRLVYYDVRQVQKLLDLIHRDADPVTDADDVVTDVVA